MNNAHTSEPVPAQATPAAAGEAPIGVGEKLIVILFLIGVGLFGLISLAELLSNLFR